jgi:hypothetical protein
VARGIHVQRAEYPLVRNDVAERRQHGPGTLLRDELRVIDRARGIGEDSEQIARRLSGELRMRAGIGV